MIWKGVEFLKIEVNKKMICTIIITIFLLSALVYNILYINNKKNEIIDEIEIEMEGQEIIEEVKTIFVDIGGEVINPGLYELVENSRINDAINMAGGVTDKADLTDVNLAYILSDAMKIIIPKKETKKVVSKTTVVPKIVTTEINMTENQQQISNMININTATKEQLKTLTGIGEATAKKIIDYRNEKGNFSKIEDVKNVSGIGESKYEKIKGMIVV